MYIVIFDCKWLFFLNYILVNMVTKYRILKTLMSQFFELLYNTVLVEYLFVLLAALLCIVDKEWSEISAAVVSH